MNGSFKSESIDKASQMLSGAFGEVFSESYDFVRCQKADGSYYGTDTKCLSGIKTDKPGTVARAVGKDKEDDIRKVSESIRKKVKKRSGRELTPAQIAAILAKDPTPYLKP